MRRSSRSSDARSAMPMAMCSMLFAIDQLVSMVSGPSGALLTCRLLERRLEAGSVGLGDDPAMVDHHHGVGQPRRPGDRRTAGRGASRACGATSRWGRRSATGGSARGLGGLDQGVAELDVRHRSGTGPHRFDRSRITEASFSRRTAAGSGNGCDPSGFDCHPGADAAGPRCRASRSGGVTLARRRVVHRARPATRSAWSAATAPARPACSRCSAARPSPRGGVVMRKGGLGYLPQDPRIDGVPDDVTGAHPRAVGSRLRRRRRCGIEKLRLRMEEDPTRAQRRPLQPGRGALPRSTAATRPSREVAPHRRRPRPRRRPARPAARRAVAAASAAGSSSPASCSPAATCCCSTSRPTTSTSTPRTWLLDFLRSYRGALLVISHDLDLLDEAITRVLHLDRAARGRRRHDRRVQGHLQRSTCAARERDEERLAKHGGRAGQGDRPAADARRPLRRQGHQGGDGPQHREAHRPPRSRGASPDRPGRTS